MGSRQITVWSDGDVNAGLIPVGQSIGLIHDIVNCKDLVEGMVKDAADILKDAPKRLKI